MKKNVKVSYSKTKKVAATKNKRSRVASKKALGTVGRANAEYTGRCRYNTNPIKRTHEKTPPPPGSGGIKKK